MFYGRIKNFSSAGKSIFKRNPRKIGGVTRDYAQSPLVRERLFLKGLACRVYLGIYAGIAFSVPLTSPLEARKPNWSDIKIRERRQQVHAYRRAAQYFESAGEIEGESDSPSRYGPRRAEGGSAIRAALRRRCG